MDKPSEIRGSQFLTLEGRGTAPGYACGPLRRNSPDLSPGDAAGAILVAERAVPEDVGRILASAGTLTLGGAVLSHVSLLSREFGKPSMSLSGGSQVRLIQGEGAGLLDLEDVVGGADQPRLDERDIVLLDGNQGRLYIPGGTCLETRLRIRMVFSPLRLFGAQPNDHTLLKPVMEALGDDTGQILEFLLEAALMNRIVPSGEPTRNLLDALQSSPAHGEVLAERLSTLRNRVRSLAVRRCAMVSEEMESVTEADDLTRRLNKIEDDMSRTRLLLSDLGGAPGMIDGDLAAVRAVADRRRDSLREAVDRDARTALNTPDDILRPRVGGLFQLLRRARAASLDVSIITGLQARLSHYIAEEKELAGAHVVVPLDNKGGYRDRSLVGGKAAGLFRVIPILPEGCKVPRGFVVTSSAYRLHLLGETGENLRHACRNFDDEAEISRNARAAILSNPVPDEVVQAVTRALNGLDVIRLAVRSSATIEDGAAGSLAGQFDTYLGVLGPEELLNRIRWAWASLWNSRALRTVAASGQSMSGASQAVLVQEMVETRAAGVLFSRDPAGRPDTILVNAAWGLGEGISQGEIGGDLYWVRRSTGELVTSECSTSGRRIVLDPDKPGTMEQELPPDLDGCPCLDARDLGRLAGLARALEEATGRSQDVEFGFTADGTLMVFQVRRVVAGK